MPDCYCDDRVQLLGGLPRIACEIKAMINRTIKIKNRICAIPDAAPAIPPNPKMAAMIAITKSSKAQLSIEDSSLRHSFAASNELKLT